MLKHKKAFSAGLWFVIIFMQLCAHAVERPSNSRSYDVVIAGAGTGGFSAAIQAARLGAKVALIEETDWIGGQMAAAGVSTMDEAYQYDSALRYLCRVFGSNEGVLSYSWKAGRHLLRP